ncbi:MAG: PilZ domain-containing protein [Gammaproteobacteria bacterium]|nr:PilZ domain-containing protein [Gammaproteobacteria bacterium]
MSARELLDADELALLGEVLLPPAEGELPLPLNLPFGQLLLPLMERADGLLLVTSFGHHLLRFPVRLQRDEFGRPTLAIDAPEILETGPTLRDWRLQPLAPLRLLDHNGNEIRLRIHDLSVSGLLLEFDEQQAIPERLHLQLELPECGTRLPLAAARVRHLDGQRVAYRLLTADEGMSDRLRWFLFHQHRALHGDDFELQVA